MEEIKVMKKQTSIEWLIEKIDLREENGMGIYGAVYELIDQAKAMHKEEMGRVWNAAIENYEERGDNGTWEDFDNYYKETFTP